MIRIDVRPLDWIVIKSPGGSFWEAPNPFGGLPLQATTTEEKVYKDNEHRKKVRGLLTVVEVLS